MTRRVRMRFRDDAWHAAEAKALGRMCPHGTSPQSWIRIPPARPGDTWRVRWKTTIEQEARGIFQGPIAGYAIGCVICGQVHAWTTATNCASLRARPEHGGIVICDHSGTGSCWNWTGSAEDHTLSGTPSLWSQKEKGGCGFHGYLTNGWLSG